MTNIFDLKRKLNPRNIPWYIVAVQGESAFTTVNGEQVEEAKRRAKALGLEIDVTKL